MAKTDYIQVRFEPHEKEVLKEMADAEGVKMSHILRSPVIQEMKRRKKKGAIA